MQNQDKFYHLAVGFCLEVVFCLLGYPRFGLLLVLGVGYGKELFDKSHPEKHTADWMDFIITVVGGILARLFFLPT